MPLRPNPANGAQNQLPGLRAVVADDDPASRKLVQYQLQKRGLDVYVASNGTEAWDLLQSGDAPTIALLDWVMPGPDGVELCRRIRSLKRKHYIYAMLLTGKDDRQSLIEGLQAGADDYLCKPLDPFELEARVNVARRIIAFQNSLVIAQERLALAEGGGRSASFDWDIRKNVSRWSPGMEKLYGSGPDKLPGTYQAWESLVLPEDRTGFRNAIRKSFATGEFSAEWRICGPDNQTAWIGGRGKVFFDESGLPLHIVGINLDITAQKLAEIKLKEQAALLDLAHDAIVVLGMDWKIIFWNRGAQQIYGWSAEEVIGKKPPDFLQTRYPVPFEKTQEALFTQDQWKGELVHFTKGGAKIIIATRWSLQRDENGTPIGVLLINRDITRKKQAEARLKVREAITSILADAKSLTAATPRVLKAICECMDWQVGQLWGVDITTQVLRYVEGYCTEPTLQDFEQDSRTVTFKQGEGLPGRVWERRQPAWIEDITTEPNFLRTEISAKFGLRGAFAFPLRHPGQVPSVMVFFSREPHPFDLQMTELFSSIGSQIGQFIGRKRSEKALAASEEHYRNLVEASTALICIHDLDGNIHLINPAAAQSLGYTLEQVVGKNIRAFLDPAGQSGFDGFLKEMREKLATSGRMAVRDSQGRRRIWVFTNRVVQEEGNAPYVIGHAQDVTELIEAQNALQKSQKAALELEKRLSRNDPLTGLANRRSFYETAEKERKRAARYERPLTVAYIDLDNFKQVNDTSGHQVGDQVLIRVAQVLNTNVRSECLPARLGGDEFALLMPEADYSAANIVTRKVHRMLTNAMQVENWPVTFSIGVATYNDVPDSTDQMLQAADKLMYKVKNEGKGFIAASIIEVEADSADPLLSRKKRQASAALSALNPTPLKQERNPH